MLCIFSYDFHKAIYVRSNIWVEDQRSGSLDQGHGDSSPLDPVARVNIGSAKLMVDTYLWGWSKTHIHNPNYIIHKVGVKSFGVHPNSKFLFGSDNWYFDSRATHVTWFFSSHFFRRRRRKARSTSLTRDSSNKPSLGRWRRVPFAPSSSFNRCECWSADCEQSVAWHGNILEIVQENLCFLFGIYSVPF